MSEETKLVKKEFDGIIQPAHLEKMVEIETANRAILTKYIGEHLKEGTDYGKIHIVGKDKCPRPWECKNPYHFSKDTLFKSGSEKFTSLFKLRPLFKRDDETWEAMGKQVGLFCYVCMLTTIKGDVAAEGRGACSVGEKTGNINSAIKIAQKRAQMDAVLRHGALSDFFTQDLEDMKVVDVDDVEIKPEDFGETQPTQPEYIADPAPAKKQCPLCKQWHTGSYPKCFACWKKEKDGVKIVETKTIINEDAPPFYTE